MQIKKLFIFRFRKFTLKYFLIDHNWIILMKLFGVHNQIPLCSMRLNRFFKAFLIIKLQFFAILKKKRNENLMTMTRIVQKHTIELLTNRKSSDNLICLGKARKQAATWYPSSLSLPLSNKILIGEWSTWLKDFIFSSSSWDHSRKFFWRVNLFIFLPIQLEPFWLLILEQIFVFIILSAQEGGGLNGIEYDSSNRTNIIIVITLAGRGGIYDETIRFD